MKSDIENFKYLFQIEDDVGIGGKCTCVQLIARNQEWSNCKTTVLFRLVLGKEKLKNLVTISELYLLFDQFTQYKGKKRKKITLILDHVWRESR